MVARTKRSSFLQFGLFSFKNKNGAQKKRFAHLIENETGKLLVEKDSKKLKTPQGLLQVCISTLILVINFFCFNN